jgi:hypothetical protein
MGRQIYQKNKHELPIAHPFFRPRLFRNASVDYFNSFMCVLEISLYNFMFLCLGNMKDIFISNKVVREGRLDLRFSRKC